MGDNEGVMDGGYASGRQKKMYMRYRYLLRARQAVELIQRYGGGWKTPSVLDLGSAEGLTLVEMHRLLPGGTFTGVEYSQELLHVAHHLPAGVHILQGDVQDLPQEIKSRRFDAVIALAILEHLMDPVGAVRQAAEVLQPGGLFIASCPDPVWDDLSGLLASAEREHHVTRMNKKNLVDTVKDAGLELVTFERFMWAPLGFLPYLKVWVDPGVSLRVDRFVRSLLLFNGLFVNACVVGRKASK